MRHAWLSLALLWCLACSGPTPDVDAPPPPERQDVPDIVIAEDLPTASSAEPVVLDDGETVNVGSVERLLRSIRSNRTIRLRPGTYDLGSVPHTEHDFVRWEKVYDGEEAVIDGVENLTIEALGPERPTILARPRYAFVLKLRNVKNVAFKNVVLGHTPEGGCTGGVIGAEGSEGISIVGSDLFGSGTVGVSLKNVKHFQLDKSSIRECTYGIAEIAGSEDVVFTDSKFVDNAEYDLVDVQSSPNVRFERCVFSKNRIDKGYGHVFFKIDKDSAVVLDDAKFDANTFDQLTNDKARLKIVGGQAAKGWAQKQLAKPNSQYNEIYALARYRKWIVAGTQAGIVFWNPATGSIDKLVKAYISGHLMVRGKYLWAGTYRRVIRFDGLQSKSYLQSQKTRGGQLISGPGGKLFIKQDKLVQIPNHWWLYDDQGDRFVPAPGGGARQTPTGLGAIALGGFYDVRTRPNGEIWAIDFLRSLARHEGGKTTVIPLKGSIYPGRDPRRFYVDPRGALWAVDFESGFLKYDDAKKVFVADPTVTRKGSAMAVDVQRKRTWLLHYTDGLHLLQGKKRQFWNLSRLQYMRALLLDKDGSVWVGGWNALLHLERQGAKGWRERTYEVSSATLAPGVTP